MDEAPDSCSKLLPASDHDLSKGLSSPESGTYSASRAVDELPSGASPIGAVIYSPEPKELPFSNSFNRSRPSACGDSDSIVVSGVSCRFPESDSTLEFKEHLFHGDDMITTDNRRWEPGIFDLPKRHGKLKTLQKFDAAAFGVHAKQANAMDPQLRILLEVAFEAICDAGYSPNQLRGSNTGVFVGCSDSETGAALTSDPETIVGYSLTGCVRSMFANRLSYSFDFRGPSFAVDTACSSSLQAMQLALDALRLGQCSAALVAGTHLNLAPTSALQFKRLGMLSDDGMCKSFDVEGEGYVRAEGICAIFLQKSKDARRCYATLLNARGNTDGYKPQGITFPNGERQADLLRLVYEDAGIDPTTVSYVETHGTGTRVGDPEEANAVADVFCTKDRVEPLLIGSVKSNMGHSEPTSGLASLTKVILAMESGRIPPNLHFTSPNPAIPALFDGRMRVVTELTPWSGGIVGINSFGFGGSNVHVILRSNAVSLAAEPDAITTSEVPQLFCCAGRTREASERLLNACVEDISNHDFLHLMAAQAHHSISTHPFRGFVVFDRSGERFRDIQRVTTSERKPVWFVYTGMGSQWAGMGRDLMMLDSFRESINRCAEALQPFNIDLRRLILSGTDADLKQTSNTFVCIAAVQIALTDVLKRIGVEPDGIVGHSVGELGCSYADGCLTAEQTVLCAYWRGQCVEEGSLPCGAMASVGLSWDEAQARCPVGVRVACYNAEDNVTVSGDATAVQAFVQQLVDEDVFAKDVRSGAVAFHSDHMQMIAPALRARLCAIMPTPKRRSSRWISSSVPENKWDSELAKYCSVDYHVNNLTSPVLFYPAVKLIPDGAVVIEVAPHCLLQALLKRSLPSNAQSFGLMKAKESEGVPALLANLGRIYAAGVDMSVERVCRSVPKWPVARGTRMIGPLIQWDHSTDWHVVSAQETSATGGKSSSCRYNIDPYNVESTDSYLLDHVIDGRVFFPFTGHLVLAWRTLCKLKGLNQNNTSVIFEDICVERATILKQTPTHFEVLLAQSGHFEIFDEEGMVAQGKVSVAAVEQRFVYEGETMLPTVDDLGDSIQLRSADIYREFLLRGYDYGPAFQGIHTAENSGNTARLRWTGNWVTFLDALFQTALIAQREDTLRLPVRLTYAHIDPEKHRNAALDLGDGAATIIAMRNMFETNGCVAGGVEAMGLAARTVPRRWHQLQKPTLEKVYFVPLFDDQCLRMLPSYRQLIGDYVAACSDLIQRLQWESPTGLALTPSSTRLDGDPKYCLRAFLDHATRNSLPSALAAWDARDSDLTKDTLCSSLWHLRMTKPLIDLVLENTASHRGKCAAIEPPTLTSALLCKRCIASHPLCDSQWTVISQCLDSCGFTEEIVQCNGLDELTCVRFDSMTTGQHIVPDSCKELDLALLDFTLHLQKSPLEFLRAVKAMLRADGFLLIGEVVRQFELGFLLDVVVRGCAVTDRVPAMARFLTHEQWLRLFVEAGYDVVSWQTDPSTISCLYLLRNVSPNTVKAVFVNVDDIDEYSWLEDMQSAIERSEADNTHVWIVSNKLDSGVLGLALSLKEENTRDHRVRVLCNSSLAQNDSMATKIDLEDPEIQEKVKQDMMINIRRDGVWGTVRHLTVDDSVLMPRRETEHAFLDTLVRGDLSSVTWMESANSMWTSQTPSTAYDMYAVHFAALNFRDVMLASGRLSVDTVPGAVTGGGTSMLGMEFSGCSIATGRRVMGLVRAQALATTVVAEPRFCFDVPGTWSLEQAATVPAVYATALYALKVRGRMKRGDTVLIHSGSGGVGQAAIALALTEGCTVITTVGSEEKRCFLQQRFPQLQAWQFAHSRTTEFEQHVMKVTGGRGCDLVLNSLTEEKFRASVRCLAWHGRFLEIGKFDLSQNANLGLAVFLRNVTFHGILLDALFEESNVEWREVEHLLRLGLESGCVVPLPATVFSSDQAEEALRYMAQGKHIGKVLLRIRDEPTNKLTKVMAIARTVCHAAHVYLVTGGLGGFGLELANWLVQRGAKKVVLTSRSVVKTGYQRRLLSLWRSQGVLVETTQLDVAKREDAYALIRMCQSKGRLTAVFHLAMVLRDSMFENQTVENFQESAAAKHYGTRHLDEATRTLCGDTLEHFVVFSSIACGRGNKGQTSYGWANSTMERIVEKRRHDGLAGIAIQWGAVGDVGVVLDTFGNNSCVVGGTLPQRMPSCLQTLDCLLAWNHPIVSSFVRAPTSSKIPLTKSDVVQSVSHILGISDCKQLDLDAPLATLGLDSLMAVEIRQMLERDFDVSLSMKDIRTMTLSKLKAVSLGGTAVHDQKSDVVELATNPLSFFGLRMDANELRPLDPIVLINGITQGRPLFCVHSIEGVKTTLECLAAQLPVPVYCFQCGPDATLDSVETLAEYYITYMKRVQPTGPYNLLGYSYGATVAYEMAWALQQRGEQTGRLILLDSSHRYMQAYRTLYRSAYNVRSELASSPVFEAEILAAFAMRFAAIDYVKFRKTLLAMPAWTDRLMHVVNACTHAGTFADSDVARFAAQSLYDKFRAADKYDPVHKEKYSGNVTLIRPVKGSLKEADVGKDYGLHEVVSGNVEVHVVAGDHASFVYDEGAKRTAELILQSLAA